MHHTGSAKVGCSPWVRARPKGAAGQHWPEMGPRFRPAEWLLSVAKTSDALRLRPH